MSKVLVAFFSASGNTSKLASTLSDAVCGKLHSIEPKTPYTSDDLDWRNPNSRSSVEMSDKSSRPEIANKAENIESYDTIFIGFPIWWYIAPTIINTFLEQYDLHGKTIIPFATSGSSGMGKTNDYLKNSCKGANLMDGKVFSPDASASELKEWVRSLNITE